MRLAFEGDDLVVTMPDGARVRCDADLLAVADQRAAQAEAFRSTFSIDPTCASADRAADAIAGFLDRSGIDPHRSAL